MKSNGSKTTNGSQTTRGPETAHGAKTGRASDLLLAELSAPSPAGPHHYQALMAGPTEAVLTDHLTEQQIDEELMGDLGPPWDRHLAGCDLCGARVSKAAAPLAAFQAVTLAWGERRSATLPLRPESLHRGMARSASFHPYLAWAASAALALAVGFSIPLTMHHNHSEAPRESVRIGTMSPTQAISGSQASASHVEIAESSTTSREEIVRDNQMLQAIDRDLDSADDLDASARSAAALGLQPLRTAAPTRSAHLARMQD